MTQLSGSNGAWGLPCLGGKIEAGRCGGPPELFVVSEQQHLGRLLRPRWCQGRELLAELRMQAALSRSAAGWAGRQVHHSPGKQAEAPAT